MSQEAAHEAVEAFLRGERTPSFPIGNAPVSKAEIAELQRPQGVHFTNTTGAGAARPPRHHIFVPEHVDWFRSRGVDIDRYTLELTQGEHSAVHTLGWNKDVQRFIESEKALGREFTRMEILRFGVRRRRRYHLQHVKVTHYGG